MRNVSGRSLADPVFIVRKQLLSKHHDLAVVNLSTSYLTDEIRVLSGAYGRALSGVPGHWTRSKRQHHLAQGPFKAALGLWYAHEKFSSKADVEKSSNYD